MSEIILNNTGLELEDQFSKLDINAGLIVVANFNQSWNLFHYCTLINFYKKTQKKIIQFSPEDQYSLENIPMDYIDETVSDSIVLAGNMGNQDTLTALAKLSKKNTVLGVMHVMGRKHLVTERLAAMGMSSEDIKQSLKCVVSDNVEESRLFPDSKNELTFS